MKKPSSKARGDAKLKMLPDLLKEELFQFLRANTQEKTLAWLKEEHEVSSSSRALTEFYDWYPRQGFVRQAATIADQIKQAAGQIPQLQKDAKTVGEIAQVTFEVLAAQNRDSGFFLDLKRERREEAKLQLDREKHEWAKKTDVEKVLDAVHAEIKADAVALDLFNQLAARMAKLREAKA